MSSKRQTHRSSDPLVGEGVQQKMPIYLDHNSTTPLDSRVLEAMRPYMMDAFGNAASRTHSFGHAAERAVQAARLQVAALINAEEKEIIWTSGATEANNLAIKGAAYANRDHGRHIITQATEHNAVLDPCKWLGQEGFELTVLPVDGDGKLRSEQVAEAIRPDTILVSIMWANNEIGTIQPIREIGGVCRDHNVIFHTDATQAVGKIPVDVRVDAVDLLSFSGHKLYGPKGCGALYVRQRTPRIKLVPLLHGGGHERGMRSGTINVPGVVGVGAACEICRREMFADATKISVLRDDLERGIVARVGGTKVNGDTRNRLPHTTHLSFEDVEAEAMLVALEDVALSTGSACTSASVEPSHVLSAIGLDESAIYGSIRFGLGRGNTAAEVQHVIKRIADTVARLRELRQLA